MPKERANRGQSAQSEKGVRNMPNPTMCKEGKGVRNFSCINYDTCLDKAAKAMWSGFTCRECPQNNQKEEESVS